MLTKFCAICEKLFVDGTENCPEDGLRLRAVVDRRNASQKRHYWMPCGLILRQICLACSREFAENVHTCPDDGTALIALEREPEFQLSDRFADLHYLSPSTGRSCVFRGTDLQDGKNVVIKVASGDPQRYHRFLQEAQIVSSLNHPNIVAFRESGYVANSVPYYITEFAPGQSLETMFRQGKIAIESQLKIFVDVSDAMQHGHDNAVVHWDFKPADIMVDELWHAKIFDFGKGKPWIHGDNMHQQATARGDVFGEPAYVAPEVCRGAVVDARANIYSLACMMYACLQGRPPFEGNNWLHTTFLKLEAPLPPFSDLVAKSAPPQLIRTIMRGLSVQPELRQSSMAEVKAELELCAARAVKKDNA